MRIPPQQITRFAALGAFAMAGALTLALVLFCWFIAPRGVGIDRTESAVAQIAVGLILLFLIAVHVVFGRILLTSAAKG